MPKRTRKTTQDFSAMGRAGGASNVRKGTDYFRRISLMRKTFGGGRPKGSKNKKTLAALAKKKAEKV